MTVSLTLDDPRWALVEEQKEGKILEEREHRKYEWYLKHWMDRRKHYHPRTDGRRNDEPPKEASFNENDVTGEIAPDENPPSF